MRVHLIGVLAFSVVAGAAALQAEETTAKAAGHLTDRFGDKLVNAGGQTKATSELGGKKVGIYFSAHWCPPCRFFTPKLVEFYNEVTADSDDFEIVFVSSDRDRAAMDKYMKEAKMPWLALPYESELRGALSQEFGVRGIPTLVILDEDGKLVTKDGRADVHAKGPKAFAAW